jgi:hypothetical protein
MTGDDPVRLTSRCASDYFVDYRLTGLLTVRSKPFSDNRLITRQNAVLQASHNAQRNEDCFNIQ